MGTGDRLLGATLRWTSIPFRGEWQHSPLLHATETGLSGFVCLSVRLSYPALAKRFGHLSKYTCLSLSNGPGKS